MDFIFFCFFGHANKVDVRQICVLVLLHEIVGDLEDILRASVIEKAHCLKLDHLTIVGAIFDAVFLVNKVTIDTD